MQWLFFAEKEGIIRKLDYLKDLGVNVLWLCPVYRSPMCDNGYDVADYYQVDPLYGTNADLEELIAEAGKRDIRIILDMVVNHCSDEHEWFQKALRDPEGKYGRYFYIRKGVNGGPPNNWRSIFGGSAWEPILGTPFIYQGEELGMRNVCWPSITDYNDCSSLNHYEQARREAIPMRKRWRAFTITAATMPGHRFGGKMRQTGAFPRADHGLE